MRVHGFNSLSQFMETTWETDAMHNCKDNHQMDQRETVCKWTGFVRFRTGSRRDAVNTAIGPDLHKTRKLAKPTQPWVFKPRPTRLHYATRGHICKLCIQYKDYTVV